MKTIRLKWFRGLLLGSCAVLLCYGEACREWEFVDELGNWGLVSIGYSVIGRGLGDADAATLPMNGVVVARDLLV